MTNPAERKITKTLRLILLLAVFAAVGTAWIAWPGKSPESAAGTATATLPAALSSATSAPAATATPAPSPTAAANLPDAGNPYPNGLIVLSLSDGYYKHLFAYHPQDLQFTRLTDHPWDDIDPAVSPDGTRLAYASRRNGFFDIYIFDLPGGRSTRITDTPAYDGHPAWSPDGQWLAYESYQSGNLDIYVQSLADLTQPALQLTDDPAADYAPDWSPGGSLLAFTSLRSGEPEIWSAALDQGENRFANLSRNPDSSDSQPAWSPDGTQLAWVTRRDGLEQVVVSPAGSLGTTQKVLGAGSAPLWRPAGSEIYALVRTSGGVSLTGYDAAAGQLALPLLRLPTDVHGWDWQAGALTGVLPAWLLGGPGAPATPLAGLAIQQSADPVTGRVGLVALNSITAPYAYLSDAADEVFYALRTEVARLSGWDVLANLENAFLPVTEPSLPGVSQDWLVTGLGIAINPLPYQAGWLAIQREDLDGQTWWRLFILARYQDGSMGQPLTAPVWDLNARSSGDPRAYEQGGAPGGIPAGYWIDFTELASRFGWQRLPAFANWRTYYGGARFNQFAFTGGRDWEAAMQQLYPPELVHQPTPVPSQTSAPTSTPLPQNILTATALATPWAPPLHLDPRPTWTPEPGESFP